MHEHCPASGYQCGYSGNLLVLPTQVQPLVGCWKAGAEMAWTEGCGGVTCSWERGCCVHGSRTKEKGGEKDLLTFLYPEKKE
jgi:hypothetical protein